MDLVFPKAFYFPPKEFWGNLTEEKFSDIFGSSSRFIAQVLFKSSSSSFEKLFKFVIDTGAFISYAPDVILEDLGLSPEFEGYIRGADPQDKCKVKTKVAKTKFILIDENGKESKELTAWFAFHSFDRGPFLLGMKDILEHWGIIKKIDQNSLILQISE